MDLKRYYHDIDHSVAYGHPSIPVPMEVETNLPSTSSRPAKRSRDDRGLMFETNKRYKKSFEGALKRCQV